MRTLDLGGILIVSERPWGEGPLALPPQYPFPGRSETYERVVRGAQPAHTDTVLVAMTARAAGLNSVEGPRDDPLAHL